MTTVFFSGTLGALEPEYKYTQWVYTRWRNEGALGRRIARVVNALGWTNAHMLRGMGVMWANFFKYRHGCRRPKAEFVLKLEAVERWYAEEIELAELREELKQKPCPHRKEKEARRRELRIAIGRKQQGIHRPADLASVGVVGSAPTARSAQHPAIPARYLPRKKRKRRAHAKKDRRDQNG